MKTIAWIVGILLVAFGVALIRGMEFGFQWEMLPDLLFGALVFGGPGYILVFAVTKGRAVRRGKAASIAMVTGFSLGCLWMSFEESRFEEEASVALNGEFERSRWWPLTSYTIGSSGDSFWAYD